MQLVNTVVQFQFSSYSDKEREGGGERERFVACATKVPKMQVIIMFGYV